jgi:predicted  nucleic acid-binding Zn-ribbon protein
MSADLAALQRELSAISTLAKQNPKDKHYAYQHKILQLLLREKTATLANTQLTAQLTQSQNELSRTKRDSREMEDKWEREISAARREMQEARQETDRLRAEAKQWRSQAEEAEM